MARHTLPLHFHNNPVLLSEGGLFRDEGRTLGFVGERGPSVNAGVGGWGGGLLSGSGAFARLAPHRQGLGFPAAPPPHPAPIVQQQVTAGLGWR